MRQQSTAAHQCRSSEGYGYLPTDKRATNATISERARRRFASLLVKEDTSIPLPTGGVSESARSKLTGEMLDADVRITTLAFCSDGTRYANPKALTAITIPPRQRPQEPNRGRQAAHEGSDRTEVHTQQMGWPFTLSVTRPRLTGTKRLLPIWHWTHSDCAFV